MGKGGNPSQLKKVPTLSLPSPPASTIHTFPKHADPAAECDCFIFTVFVKMQHGPFLQPFLRCIPQQKI